MTKRVMLIAGVVTTLLLALGALLVYLGSRPVIVGPVQRTVDPAITVPGGTIGVELILDAAALPSCDAGRMPLDIVLLLDRSASMADNNAVVQAGNAAATFAENLKGTDSQVALVAFNATAETLSPLGASPSEIRMAVTGLAADGNTQISLALAAAQAILFGGRQNSAKVIVLLSDGGGQDESAALAQALDAKQAGIYVITVALPGGQQQPDHLRRIATSDESFYPVASLPQLEDLYRGLARSLVMVSARDVQVIQPYARQRFNLQQGTAHPLNVEVTPERLLWRLPVLQPETVRFSYLLSARSIGWHDVAGTNGEIAMVDCLGAFTTLPTLVGPKVLVSPIPALLWLLLPLMFFVPLFLFARRPKTPPISPRITETEPAYVEFHHKLPKSSWLNDVGVLESLQRPTSPIQYPHALVIGLGKSGQQILGQLRRSLSDQSGGEMPDKVRLLAIDARFDGNTGGSNLGQTGRRPSGTSNLDAGETLSLVPNLHRVTERLQSNDLSWSHLRWWGDHTADDPGRAGSRMALFYDLLLGEEQSLVWAALRKRLDGLQKPLVYIVGSLADPVESGMLLDLPHFVRQMADHLATGTRRVIALFLLQRTGSGAPDRSEGGRNTYAAVRELQRILLREPFSFEYNPSIGGTKLIGSTDSTPIDACYLVDGLGEKELDLQQIPEEQGTYQIVADALMTLLSSAVASWHQDYINTLPQVARRTEELTGLPTVSSLNCAVVQFPSAMLKHVLKERFLLDLVFGGPNGQSPLGLARLDPGSERPKLDARSGLDGRDARQRAVAFLREGGSPNRHALMGILAQVAEGRSIEEADVARTRPEDERLDNVFRWALEDELRVFLNGTTGDVIANRSGKIGSAIAFLTALSQLLRDLDAEIPRRLMLPHQPGLRQAVAARTTAWRRTVENTLEDARRWEQMLIASGGGDNAARRAQRVRPGGITGATYLHGILMDRWKATQSDLERARKTPLRKLIGVEDAEQESIYQRYLGPERLKASGLKPLESAMSRLGWLVESADDRDLVRLRLVVVPPSMSGAVATQSYAFTPDQISELIQALDRLAQHFLPLINAERLGDHLDELGAVGLGQHLLRGEAPLARYDRTTMAETRGAVSSQLVLSLAEPALRSQVEDYIKQQLAVASPVKGLTSDDPDRFALVGLTDIIAVEGLDAVVEASMDYSSDALAHVFMAEQVAAGLERDWRTRRGQTYRFHPRFVRLLDNPELLRSLALAEMYGLLTVQRTAGDEEAILAASELSAAIPIIRSAGLTSFDIFHEAYHLWLKAPSEHPLSRSRWPATRQKLEAALARERQQLNNPYDYMESKRDEIGQRIEQELENPRRLTRSQRRRPWFRDVDIYLWLLAEQEKRSALN